MSNLWDDECIVASTDSVQLLLDDHSLEGYNDDDDDDGGDDDFLSHTGVMV